MLLSTVFLDARDQGASDIHLSSGQPPIFRVDGGLVATKNKAVTSKEIESLARAAMGEHRWEVFLSSREMDFAITEGETRFRVNVHFDRGAVALAARVIPSVIPTLEELGLGDIAPQMTASENGLILVTGPTGSGKSTSLASMISYLNQTKPYHTVTLEDPIEYMYPQGLGLIKQRELGSDTLSFAEGIKRCLRQDPDIVMVGEMRDPDTIASTLTLAETGHLVFSTLHTNNAAQSVYRIVDSFEGPEQEQIRRQLSLSLRGVISQTLLPTTGGGRVAAREVMMNSPAIANLIRENRVEQISTMIQTGRAQGMFSMAQHVQMLLSEGTVTEEEVALHLPNVLKQTSGMMAKRKKR